MERSTQQSIGPAMGARRASQACAPTCFYMVAQAAGYLPAELDLTTFCRRLDWADAFLDDRGWVRPRLARQLRRQYGLVVVSWQLGGNKAADDDTIDRMIAAGYLAIDREIDFYRREVVGRDLSEVVQAGYPVIAGMKAGFGENKQTHAVVILNWDDKGVEIIDPDDRNSRRHYPVAYVREFLNPTGGGCTVVLPRKIDS
jgi:hypothetical protein